MNYFWILILLCCCNNNDGQRRCEERRRPIPRLPFSPEPRCRNDYRATDFMDSDDDYEECGCEVTE